MTGARMSHQYHSFCWVVHFCPWCPEQLEGHLKFSLLAHLLCLADEGIIYSSLWSAVVSGGHMWSKRDPWTV